MESINSYATNNGMDIDDAKEWLGRNDDWQDDDSDLRHHKNAWSLWDEEG